MAGAGWKDFVPGQVLSAANVQDYLQDQSVMVFASAAARTSALASPSEGMVSYLKDTDTVERFNGSSWVVPFSVANGGTGATTVAGAQANLDIAILQVVQDTKFDAFGTTSTTYVDVTGLEASITPISTTNKVLVMVSINLSNTLADGGRTEAQVLRGATAIGNASGAASMATVMPAGTNITRLIGHSTFMRLDSPATTSATTYKVQLAVSGGTGYVNRSGLSSDLKYVSSITLMEVKA